MGLFGTQGVAVDPLYRQLSQHPTLSAQRSFIDGLYARYLPYKDDNFETAFASECLAHFWEMYLACALCDAGFQLLSRKDLPKGGPDLCVESAGQRIWIEAVTITSGSGADRIVAPTYEELGPAHIVPDPGIVLRFCSAIRDKYCGHLVHLVKQYARPNEPFLIAVNSARLPVEYSENSDDLPYAIKAVLPLGEYSVRVEKSTKKVIHEGYEYRSSIAKLSGSVVPTTSFLDCAFSLISGLLFANVHPLETKRATPIHFSLLHHLSPQNPLPRHWLGFGEEWTIEKQEAIHLLHRERIIPAT